MPSLLPIDPAQIAALANEPSAITALSQAEQRTIVSHAITPLSVLQVLAQSEYPDVVAAAKLHVNWEVGRDQNWEGAIGAILQERDLGQNDRLAVELLKLGPVPMALVSPWVPTEPLLAHLQQDTLPLKYRLQVLERLAQAPTLQPLLQVASATETPLKILQRFIGELEPELRQATQQNLHCPAALIELIEGQWTIASDWQSDPVELAQLGQSCWPYIRLAVAQNPTTPVETLIHLAQDTKIEIQRAIARNPSTPEDLLLALAEYPDETIQRSIVSQENLSEALQIKLWKTQRGAIHPRRDLHPTILLEMWQRLVEHSEVPLWENSERMVFVDRPRTPLSILEKIVQIYSPDAIRAYWQKKAIEQNRADDSIVEDWSDQTLEFLIKVAQHPNVSEALLISIAQHPLTTLEFAVFQNPKTSVSLREKLFESLTSDTSANCLRSIAADTVTSPSMLERIAQRYIQKNNTSAELEVFQNFLSKLGGSPAFTAAIYAFILENQSPQHMLFYLQQDPTFRVSMLHGWLSLLQGLNAKDRSILETLCQVGIDNIKQQGGLSSRQQWATERAEYVMLYGLLDVLSNDSLTKAAHNQAHHPFVIIGLINNPNTPATARDALRYPLAAATELSSDHGVQLQLAIATNPSISLDERSAACETILRPFDHHSRFWDVQRNLAQHPHTPPQYLQRCLELPNCHEYLAKNPNIPEDCLIQLLESENTSVLREIIQNPRATVAMLSQVAQRIDLDRWAMQRNSGLSAIDRYQLSLIEEAAKAKRAADQFQTTWKHRHRTEKVKAAQNWNAYPTTLEALALDEDVAIRQTVANHRNLSATAQLRLAQDSDRSVQLTLARRNRWPLDEAAAMALVATGDREIQLALAKNEQVPPVVLGQLGLLDDPDIISTLLTNIRTPAAVLECEIPKIQDEKKLEIVLRGAPSSQWRNPNMPGELIAPFAYSENNTIRFLVARYETALPETLSLLATDHYDLVRTTIAENPATPIAALIEVAKREQLKTYAGSAHAASAKIVARKDAPAAALDYIAKQPIEWMRRQVANHPNTSTETLNWLAENESSEVILEILVKHPQVDQATLELLTAHDSEKVRAAIATLPNCPDQLLLMEFLTQTPSELVCLNLAKNPQTPLTYLELFVESPKSAVRAAVASNPSLPIGHLITLAQDKKVEVRRAIALNPATPEEWQQQLQDLIPVKPVAPNSPTLQDLPRIYDQQTDTMADVLTAYANGENEFVRFVALLNPQTPTNVLAQGAVSQAWLDRYAVAENLATPEDLRQQLQFDGNWLVRSAALYSHP